MDLSNLDIELTQRCNLACPYCYLGQHKMTGTVSRQTLLDCLDLVALAGTVKPTARRKATQVTFYGGEPLLAFEELRYCVEQAAARGYQLQFAVVSNGTIAPPEIVEFCRRHKISVQRSLDGSPAAMKICRGEGTLQRYAQATRAWKDYGRSRRMTVVPETVKYLLGSLRYMQALGFKKGFSPMPDFYSDWQPPDVEEFKRQLWALADELIRDVRAGKPPFYCYWFDRDYRERFRARRGYRSPIGCGAGRGLWCVSWDGYVFLCHRFTSEDRDSPWCAGALRDVLDGTARGFGADVRDGLQAFWAHADRPQCRHCEGRYGCTRGCYHSNVKCTGSMIEPPPLYCELKTESAKVIQYIDNALRADHPQWWRPATSSAPRSAVTASA